MGAEAEGCHYVSGYPKTVTVKVTCKTGVILVHYIIFSLPLLQYSILSSIGGGTYLTVGAVLNDGVTLAKGFKVSEKAVCSAGVNADGCRVLRGDVRRTFLKHILKKKRGKRDCGDIAAGNRLTIQPDLNGGEKIRGGGGGAYDSEEKWLDGRGSLPVFHKQLA